MIRLDTSPRPGDPTPCDRARLTLLEHLEHVEQLERVAR